MPPRKKAATPVIKKVKLGSDEAFQVWNKGHIIATHPRVHMAEAHLAELKLKKA